MARSSVGNWLNLFPGWCVVSDVRGAATSDAEPRSRAGAGDAPLNNVSAESFVEHAGARLYRQAVLMEGSVERGQDLYQETVARLLSHWPEMGDVSSIDAYAYRTLVNTHRDFWRRTRWIDRRSEPDSGLQEGDFASVLARETLLPALRKLPRRQRAVVVLRYWSDLPEAAIAETMNCSVGTVKSQLSRGLRRLRAQLQEKV